jgi:fission process protein 1
MFDLDNFTPPEDFTHYVSDTVNKIKHITHEDVEIARPISYSRFLAPMLKPFVMVVKKSHHVMRPMAYSSEVGESTKSLVPKFYYPLYGLTFGYIFADTAVQVHDLHDNKKFIEKYGHGTWEMDMMLAKKATDSLLWHSLASFALPGIAVHKIVKYSSKTLKYVKKEFPKLAIQSRTIRFAPLIMGLLSIPFIIHPIDHATDFVLDNSVRKIYDSDTHYFLCDIDKDVKSCDNELKE